MKLLLSIIIAIAVFSSATAQTTLPPLRLDHYPTGPNPDVIDTAGIKKLNENFLIAKARQDHMPVLLAHGEKNTLPNLGKNLRKREGIPNAWKAPRRDTIKNQLNYRYPLFKPDDSLPHWKPRLNKKKKTWRPNSDKLFKQISEK